MEETPTQEMAAEGQLWGWAAIGKHSRAALGSIYRKIQVLTSAVTHETAIVGLSSEVLSF